ncbi:SsrA-binding protein SmpB [bacterium]|nr:SsrA-binding protein SmpB [bacterium]
MSDVKVIITNRKALRNYTILEKLEAGIALQGTEVKSLRLSKGNLNDSFARVQNMEVFLYNFHISSYEQGNIHNHEPLRPRKLLLHKQQIRRLWGKTSLKGFSLIPLRVYFKKGKVKVELALTRGKKLYDKRENIRQKEADMEARRALKKMPGKRGTTHR